MFKDIRDYQILFLSLFLILGIGTRHWTLRPELILFNSDHNLSINPMDIVMSN
jgi:Na+-transporting NADH:ubiquinone oxidoreductase subunit NqrB